jgi:hypothetical protein
MELPIAGQVEHGDLGGRGAHACLLGKGGAESTIDESPTRGRVSGGNRRRFREAEAKLNCRIVGAATERAHA